MTTTSRFTAGLATLAVATGLAVTGCGDDDPTGPTKAELVQRADAACEKWDARIDQARSEQELTRSIQGLLDELEALPVPAGDEERVEEIVASGRADLERLSGGGGEAEPFAEFSRLAGAYGLQACAASTRD